MGSSGAGVDVGPLVSQLIHPDGVPILNSSVGFDGITGSCGSSVGSGLPVSQETLCLGGSISTWRVCKPAGAARMLKKNQYSPRKCKQMTDLMARPSSASTLFRAGAILGDNQFHRINCCGFETVPRVHVLGLCGKVIDILLPMLVNLGEHAVIQCHNERYETTRHKPVTTIGYKLLILHALH